MDYATDELVTGFEDLHGGIDKVYDGFVYYGDGTIQSIDQYREDFNKYVDEQIYYNDYGNLGTEAGKYTDNSDAESLLSGASNDFSEKFSFIDGVKNNVNQMVDVICNTSSAPSFKINVNSKWYAGEMVIVDLSWYEPFKEYGDTIICIFCYFNFLWSIFKKLPGIIAGSDASSSDTSTSQPMLYSDILRERYRKYGN